MRTVILYALAAVGALCLLSFAALWLWVLAIEHATDAEDDQ